ncbi:cation:proton antiporter [Nocardioides pocheonensis]|uniref:Cation:proton antiporter n=1 Tax=Nocardioides pocheonensis TaxID=661485 RepID=A0A3N0GLJ7_9ACTN|nr:cation:proton antiporter [Nocardioides pocheonensis]RNM13269.1 cation:proton antiporter [Nocardioides pocheonensis]
MPDVQFTNLLGVLGIALVAPLALGFLPRVRVPAVVLEILLGVLAGPSVLGWLRADLAVQVVALVGLAMLLFLAGLEIDLAGLRGRVLGVAVAGYAISLGLGIGAGALLHSAGWVDDPLLLAVTVSATSLGLVVPVLKDACAAEGRLGQAVIAASSVADFAAVLLLSLLFSGQDTGTGAKIALLAAFVVLVVSVAAVVRWSGRSMRLGDVLVRLQDTTAEIRVRGAMLILLAFVVLAEKLGLESILGAFMAGAVVGLLDRGSTTHPGFRMKLDAVGFGFLIPVFFVSSGLRLDVAGLVDSPQALARVPVFVLVLLVARGAPAFLSVAAFGPRRTVAAALLQATSLPFIVTATQIGVVTGRLDGVTAAGLVCAGLVTVLLFPVTATTLGLEDTAGVRPRQSEAEPVA